MLPPRRGRTGLLAGWIFRVLGAYPGGGMYPTVLAAFVGAAIVMIAQRKFWHVARLGT